MKFAHVSLVPLRGFLYREARDVALSEVAERLVQMGVITENQTREEDGWKITFTLNPEFVSEKE